MTTSPDAATVQTIAAAVRAAAEKAGVFGAVSLEGARLTCEARASAEPAEYRVDFTDDGVWVALVMEDRWQSESIEADLMHSGDKLEELLEEELVDQGYEGDVPGFEHFRSDDMLFTFRSKAPVDLGSGDAASVIAQFLMAYEACFAQLGDMSAAEPE